MLPAPTYCSAAAVSAQRSCSAWCAASRSTGNVAATCTRGLRGPGFAPRQTNLVICERAQGAPPYYEPFLGTSSMLYMSDLETHPEYVAALLVHMERLALIHLVPATVAYNLSYWFDRDAESRAHFAAAARNAQRPDAAAFIALAEAFDWIDELLHDPLRPPGESVTEPCIHIEGADLYVPKRLREPFMASGAVGRDQPFELQ